jgi:hypothetical protein
MMLLFETKEGSVRVLHSIVDFRFVNMHEGPSMGWWRKGNPIGFCLLKSTLERRCKRIAIINEASTMGDMPLFIFDEGHWRV